MWEWAFEWGHWWWSVGIYLIDKPTVLCCSHWIWGWFHLFPHIFVWGSCFWFCIPGSSPPPRLLLPPPSLCQQTHIIFHTQLCHTSSHTYSFTHNFVTHHLSHTTLSYTTLSPLSHTICHTSFVTHHLTHLLSHTQLCHTSSFTHNFVIHNFVSAVTHHLSHTTLSHIISHIFFHTTLSHIIFHTQLCHTQLCLRCHTPSVTHHLSHIISHIFFHTQLCHTSSFTHNFVTHHLSHIICHTSSHTSSFTHNFVAGVALGDNIPAFCLAGVPLTALGRLWVARLDRISRRWRRGTLRGRRGTWRHLLWFGVAGVALGHIYLRFAWQAWHLWHWAGSAGALGPD